MSNSYVKLVKSFEDKKCKLLTTEEEFNIIKQNKVKYPKYFYTASCGSRTKTN